MLKLVKWAYDLGVRHERVRLAAHLQVQAQGARLNNDVMDNMLRDEYSKAKPNKKGVERLDFHRAVNHRVEEIINDIFDSKGDWIPGASVMFPDDKHTGEIK